MFDSDGKVKARGGRRVTPAADKSGRFKVQTVSSGIQNSEGLTLDAFAANEKKRVGIRKEKPKMAESWGEMWKAWPMSTVLIVANEFFQKFASLGSKS